MRRIGADVLQVDELDVVLLDLLATDPRISNVALAAEAGISDDTVSTRLRKLLAAGALAMTVLIDWQQAGFGAHAYVRLRTAGATPAAIVKPLVTSQTPHLVATTTGTCEVVVGLLGTDIDDVRRQLISAVRPLAGVINASMSVVTEACRHELHATTLPLPPWSTELLRHSPVGLDDLDLRLIELMVTSAHESNRWLARRLQVSDGTVRSRLSRLEQCGLLRVAAVRDTVTVGDVRSAAFVFVDVSGDDAEVLRVLQKSPNIGTIDRCVGDASIVAVATASSEDELHSFIADELYGLPEVARVDVATVLEALHHKANLVRLL